MESPTLWKGLLYIIRHWETFGIHLLIKALEDGAKELISHQSAQADCSLKYFLPITRYSRGWFCPKTQIVEAAIQPANQMARIHWEQSLQRRWQHASGDIYVYICIYKFAWGMETGEYQAAYWPSEWEPLKNTCSVTAFCFPVAEPVIPVEAVFSVGGLWGFLCYVLCFSFFVCCFSFVFSIEEPLEEKYDSSPLKIESAGMF